MNLENIKPGPSFKPWGVRAIQAGAKTQTRRAVDGKLKKRDENQNVVNTDGYVLQRNRGGDDPDMFFAVHVYDPDGHENIGEWLYDIEPRYTPGDIYYVREPLCAKPDPTTMQQNGVDALCAHYQTDNQPVWLPPGYRDDPEQPETMDWRNSDGDPYDDDTLSAIFMPRKAARLFVKCTDVWHEPFGRISREDAIAEGVECHPGWDNTPDLRDRYSLVDVDKYFNEILMPKIYGDDLPEHLVANEFEVLTRDEVVDREGSDE